MFGQYQRRVSTVLYTFFGMLREKKTRTLRLEKHEPYDSCPMIEGYVKKSLPRMRNMKSKEKIKATTSNNKCLTTTCETSGNTMRLCVNMMPVLAAAKEPVEEKERKEKDNSHTSKAPSETGGKNNPSVPASVEQILHPVCSSTGLNVDTDTRQPLNPRFVLPPITQPEGAPECCDHQKMCLTPLPPITLSEQTIASNCTVKDCKADVSVTGTVPDSRLWLDNHLFSKSRSPEFRLPDISLSSLDALLQTVTQKLGRKRRGGDEGQWRRVQSDHLLVAVREQHLSGKSVGQQTDNRNLPNNDAETETSAGGRLVNRKTSLPPLSPPSNPTVILSMTKKNIWTLP